MKDHHNREINYLRVSVTDRCNLRCKYCMPEDGVEDIGHSNILSFEEIERVIKAAAVLGISKIRLTGGEPLARKGLTGLVERIKKIDGIKEIALTTNGTLLPKYAEELKAAGLDRVNVSIDTLNEDKYRFITRGGDIRNVTTGLAAAEAAGLTPIRINVVSIAGFNDDEILDFAQLTLTNDIDVRFIELMPIGSADLGPGYKYMSNQEVREKIAGAEELEHQNGSVAAYYQYPGALGRIGLISPVSSHFCSSCNKIRLTSDGKIKPCLHSNREIDLKKDLESGDDGQLLETLREAIHTKEERHHIGSDEVVKRDMNKIGG